jgi:hypothetical protein
VRALILWFWRGRAGTVAAALERATDSARCIAGLRQQAERFWRPVPMLSDAGRALADLRFQDARAQRRVAELRARLVVIVNHLPPDERPAYAAVLFPQRER